MENELNEITIGIALNRLRKLQRRWDYWFPKRAQYPFVPADWHQEMAEKECLRLGPVISELKRRVGHFEATRGVRR